MSPEAHTAGGGGDARVPREMFAHAHRDPPVAFPEALGNYNAAYIFFKLPDNWNGIDSLMLVTVPSATDPAYTIGVNIDAATDGEAPNTHTLNVAPFNFSSTLNVFNYVDLTAAFAALLAVLVGGDTLKISVMGTADGTLTLYGAFLKET